MNDPLGTDGCEGNVKMFEVSFKGFPHLCAFVLKDIMPGQELTFAYGADFWGGDGFVEKTRNEQHAKMYQELHKIMQTQFQGRNKAHAIALDGPGRVH